MSAETRPAPDSVLTDIADYVLNYQPSTVEAWSAARLCMMDALACALDALDFPECTRLLGPLVPGTIVPQGARVPGTSYVLDPATASFNLCCMVRWLDQNDTFSGVQTCHPSDALGGLLMLGDHLSRSRTAAGQRPFTMGTLLEATIKSYEIQGCLSMKNDFTAARVDHPILTRVACAAVFTHMMKGSRDQIVNAISNAWINGSLGVFRQSPNTGWRKSWSAADSVREAVHISFMAIKGEMGYPTVLSAKKYGFYDARFSGHPFEFERPYAEHVVQHSLFKFVAAGMHSQAAVECAFTLHAQIKDRISDISQIVIECHAPLMSIMNKAGPLHNAADRDHCVQYIVAVSLLYGRLIPTDFEDHFASDPRIDMLREKMKVVENAQYTAGFYDPEKRSSASAVQIHYDGGGSTERVEIEYPIGHPLRRTEAYPVLRTKLEGALARRYPGEQCARILMICDDAVKFTEISVHEFVEMFLPDSTFKIPARA